MIIRREHSLILALTFVVSVAILSLSSSEAESRPSCLGKTVTITGTNGPDTITGTSDDDVIFTKGGDDVVQGKQGNDRVCGGDGDDELHGGEGQKDRLEGGDGADFLDGRRGFDKDKSYGGPGKDLILGGNLLDGGPGDDELSVVSYAGDLKPDTILGGPGDDDLNSDGHGDTVNGGSDSDTCRYSSSDTVSNCEIAG